MRKASFSYLFVTLALFSVLALGWLVYGPAPAGANEVRTPAPRFIQRDGSWNDQYLSDFASFFADRFYLRQECITAYAKLFGTSVTDDVIVGKDGWLYYASTLGDYTGSGGLSDRELHAAANNLKLMQEICRDAESPFLFLSVPNKNTLYPEQMPELGAVSSEHDMDKLYALLADKGVHALDLRPAFTEQVLYFAHDSHWNSRGAALGADLILDALGRKSTYFTDPFAASETHTGDLFEMRYPAAIDSETNPVYGGDFHFQFSEGSGTKPDSITISTEGSGEGSLLMYRDSFGNLLYPYLADACKNARFSRSAAYDLSQLNGETVVIELVERNLSYLVTYVPIAPAPQRTIAVSGSGGGVTLNAVPGGTQLPGYTLWKGSLPCADTDSAIYLTAGETSYECFLLTDGGFAAYIPEEVPVDGAVCLTNAILTAFNAE